MTPTDPDDLESCFLLDAFIRRKDATAFEQLFKKYSGAVRALAMRRLKAVFKDPRVDDICQQTWLAVIKCGGSFKGESRFQIWLLGIVKNLCLKELRRQKRYRALLDEVGKSGIFAREVPAPTYEELHRKEFERDVEEAVARLPCDQREVFLLRREERLTYREIAEKLRISVAWVQKLLGKCLEALDKELAKYARDEGGLVELREQLRRGRE